MSIFDRIGRKAREKPQQRAAPPVAFLIGNGDECIQVAGYTSLDQNPEIATAVDRIAKMVASMTIHLMQNTGSGDIRIQNELSKKIDIYPNRYMTRSAFIHTVVKTMLLTGSGNAVVLPRTRNGFLEDLIPVAPGRVGFLPRGMMDYAVLIDGQEYDPGDILHFTVNPDTDFPWKGSGYRVSLREVANNLKQAAATEKGFMSSKWKPSIIIKVDGLTEEFSSQEGRRKLLESYIETNEAGQPWLIPADQFSVEQVKPLSLSDLALSDMVQLDKRTVASILGVPPFVLGVGEFTKDAWNNFISTTIMPLAKGIEQELTRKLLINPDWYFRFNSRSLYAYDLKDMAAIGDDQYIRGLMTGNEVRDWLGLPPREGLDELVILENYIPLGMIGDQKKLIQGGETSSE